MSHKDYNLLQGLLFLSLESYADLAREKLPFLTDSELGNVRQAARGIYSKWPKDDALNIYHVEQRCEAALPYHRNFLFLLNDCLSEISYEKMKTWFEASYLVGFEFVKYLCDCCWNMKIAFEHSSDEKFIFQEQLMPKSERFGKLPNLFSSFFLPLRFQQYFELPGDIRDLWDKETITELEAKGVYVAGFISSPLEAADFICWWQDLVIPNFSIDERHKIVNWLDYSPRKFPWIFGQGEYRNIADFPEVERLLFPDET